MSEARLPPIEVPTLTEIIGFDAPANPVVVSDFDGRRANAELALTLRDLNLTEDLIAQRVLADLQRQVDLMFEYRLRETLSPLMVRLADNLVREVREELSSTLRDVVKRAVTQELSRQRTR